MLWEQGVEGSNPFAPTVENQGVTRVCDSYFFSHFENLPMICTQIRLGFVKKHIIIRLGFVKKHIIIRLGFVKNEVVLL